MHTRLRRLPILFALVAMIANVIPSVAATGKVNVNTASLEQLELLPRVGPALAGRIVAYRKGNDGFKKPEELMLVKGIGERTFEVLEPYVSISGKTTLSEPVSVSRAGSDE